MGFRVPRAALWAVLALVLLLGTVFLPGLATASHSYTLTGQIRANSGGVVSGMTVDLINAATHQTYTALTSGGTFSFTTGTTSGALQPGWWGLVIPPQAKVVSTGCNPCAVFPVSTTPHFQYYAASQLTGTTVATLSVQRVLSFGSTLNGNVSFSDGTKVAGANVSLLDPLYNGFVLNSATTNSTGGYTMSAPISTSSPGGYWVLQTTIPGPTPTFNFTEAKITGGSAKVNPVFNPAVQFLTYGYMDNSSSSPGVGVLTSGNATTFDDTNSYIYNQPTTPGGFYAVGTYGAGFSGGSNTFTVILSAVGYNTASFPLTVSSGNPSGGALPRNVNLTPILPPAHYSTILNFSSGFSNVFVNTTAQLGNDSTLPEMANASVAQLWAQLGLDFQSSLTFNSAGANGNTAIQNFLSGSGPFFPARQALLAINSTNLFNQPGTSPTTTFNFNSTCTTTCGLTSAATISYNWSAQYNSSSRVGLGAPSYVLSFQFRHPTSAQVFNYTVVLPSGYVLKANNPVPSHSMVVGAGPRGTFTSFTLQSLPSTTPYSQANFTIVRGGGLTANVNVTSSNFAWSTQNILSSTHGDYRVLAGVNENLTFSGQNSTFYPGTGGVNYNWTWGDSSPYNSTTSPFTFHTYIATGTFNGNLTVTGSSGVKNYTTFTIYVGEGSPQAMIKTNGTLLNAGTQQFLWVKWGATLQFNATGSSTSVFTGAPVTGIISVVAWNATAGGASTASANFSAGRGIANVTGAAFTPQFNGGGPYFVNTTVNGVPIAFKGWVYTVSVRVFDYSGQLATTSLTVLVNDTQKPTAAATVLDANGAPVANSGVTEGANHTAQLQFSAVNSTDPNNGTIVRYNWNITNVANTSVHIEMNRSVATVFSLWLDPQAKPYSVNLTVTDLAGNTNFDNVTVTVGINATTRPVLVASNLTVPNGGTFTVGSTYTIWVNITNTVGHSSTAMGVLVTFYLLPPSGSGSRIDIGGSPVSTIFYNYTSAGVVSTAPWLGPINLPFNKTIRAQISFSPARTGNFNLFANATASNEFYANYGGNQVSLGVTLNQSPTLTYLEYGAIAAGAVAVIVGLLFFFRRRRRAPAPTKGKSGSSKSGLERGSSRDEDDEDE